MQTITIDCREISSESEFWNAYLAAARPDGAGHFGRNLDAFWDALHGGPAWPGECLLVFTNTVAIESLREGAFMQRLRRIASDSKQVKLELR